MILPFGRRAPRVHDSAFVAPGASVIGDVRLERGSSVWFGAVLRADLNRIRVGRDTNVQDLCLLHVDRDEPCLLGEGIVMGHQSTAHGCVVGDGALIGIGARILSGARVGAGSLVAAGTVVLEGQRIPERSLAVGVPARVVRRLGARETAARGPWARRYRELAAVYRRLLG